jgi:hypothetical protein
MTFKLLKRRYKSTEDNEKLRRMDYFNQPFEFGNEIKLMDDLDLPKPLAIESLSAQFGPVEDKNGVKNAMEREHRTAPMRDPEEHVFKSDDMNSFEPFSFDKPSRL